METAEFIKTSASYSRFYTEKKQRDRLESNSSLAFKFHIFHKRIWTTI